MDFLISRTPNHQIYQVWLVTLLTVCSSFLPTDSVVYGAEPLSTANTVRLQLRWHHQFQFAGYYAAIEKGYYQEAGLDVSLIEGGSAKNTIDEVVQGAAEYGVTNSELLLQRLNGKPLVVLASIFQHSPLVFISRKETGITVPQDLAGKIVKMSGTSRDIELQATLYNEGIGFDQLVLLKDVATPDDYFDPNIDALAAYITNQPFYLKQNNIPYNIIWPSSYGIDFYGDCLFTTEQEIKNNPERVTAFRDATLKGWEYALANQAEIINLIRNTYKSEKSLDHLKYEAEEVRKLILPDLVKIGHINPGRWEHIAKIFHQFKLIPPQYSLNNFIYEPEANRLPKWLIQALAIFAAVFCVVAVSSASLFFFNRRLQKEIIERKSTELALQQSEQKLLNYSRQTEQFSLSAASMISIRDEKILFAEMSKAIIELSDFKRVVILLFKDDPPYRELIGYAGISDEVLAKVRQADISKRWYDDIFHHGVRLGNLSCYIPHTMKYILNQDAVIYGEGTPPDSDNHWHPDDNLFVRMNDEHGEFIGAISVDTSKSGTKPTDEIVRPLEIYANLISQIIILKREHSRRQQLEQKLRISQKMEALGNLTGGIAHDFNNILGIIIGNTELIMLDTPEWNPSYHNLNEIKFACHRARDIVQHLLSFSHKSDRDSRPVNIADLLQDSLRFLRTTLPTNIELVNKLALGKEQIIADPPQIYQVLLNLCTNAIQAMEPHGGCLTLTAETEILHQPLKSSTQEIEAGNYVRVDITDTGHGIPRDTQERIFDPYYTTREFGKGTGMGLSIVHGIIQSHNGAITVRSVVGSGTTFSLFLPIMAQLPVALPPKLSLPKGTETILFVDDDEALLEVGTVMLEKLGYTVVARNRPDTAFDTFRLEPMRFQLLVTDMSMPEFSGSILAEKVLKIRPDLPIFLCTGYSETIDEQQAARIGINRYFEKPLKTEVFATAIREVMDNRIHA